MSERFDEDAPLNADAELVRAAFEAGTSTASLVEKRGDVARLWRKRAKRVLPRWSDADGYVRLPTPNSPDARLEKKPGVYPYSPTALQSFASCPYRFYLYALCRYRPAEPLDAFAVDALTRGSLLHDIYFRTGCSLRDGGLLPVHADRLPEAETLLAEHTDACIAMARSNHGHVHQVIWDDAMAEVRQDAREWLQALSRRAELPIYFELAFGLEAGSDARDAASVDEAVTIDGGLKVRGSVDLVERLPDGSLRATDYKTGKPAAEAGDVVQGGELLQPVIYALVLEKVLPSERISGGRLWYGTFRGEYAHVDVPLETEARQASRLLYEALMQSFERGCFPKAPTEGACTYCEYRGFCDEASAPRAKNKPVGTLPVLAKLRGHR